MIHSIFAASFVCGSFSIFCLAYSSVNADKIKLVEKAVKNNTIEEFSTTRGDIKISLGNANSGVIIDGKIYVWGSNLKGQLGLGDAYENQNIVEKPTLLNFPGVATQLAMGYFHSAAVIDGNLYTWGWNTNGELGLGNNDLKNCPTLVPNASKMGTITELVLGYNFSGVIANSQLYMWGRNNYGQLATGDTNDRKTPTLITKLFKPVRGLTIGNSHAGVIYEGQLLTWGNNEYNQLSHYSNSSDGRYSTNPQPVIFENSTVRFGNITHTAFGGSNSSMVMDNKFYTWGDNTYYQLGHKNTTPRTLAAQVQLGVSGTILSGGINSQMGGVIIRNEAWTWGVAKVNSGISKEIYIDGVCSEILFSASSSSRTGWGNVYETVTHQVVISNNGIRTWGHNGNGQLGLGDVNSSNDIPFYFNTIVAYDPSKPYLLNSSNDKKNIRYRTINTISDKELQELAESLLGTVMTMNLPTNAKKVVTVKSRTLGSTDFSKEYGAVSVDITYDKSYDDGQVKSIPISFNNVIINGFTSVKETQNVKLNAKVPDDDEIRKHEINELVTSANQNSTKTDLLKDWILINQQVFLGDVKNKNTINFPIGTEITNIDNFEVLDGTAGVIRFDLTVSKFYKEKSDGTNELVASWENDPPIKLTTPVTMSNFKKTFQSTTILRDNHDLEITSKDLLKDRFGYVNDNTIIDGNGLANLHKYVDLTNFPKNTAFKIIQPVFGERNLAFSINASTFYNEKGVEMAPASGETFDPLDITDLLVLVFLPNSVSPAPTNNSCIVYTIPIIILFLILIALILLLYFLWERGFKRKNYTIQYASTINNADHFQWAITTHIFDYKLEKKLKQPKFYNIGIGSDKRELSTIKYVKVDPLLFCKHNNIQHFTWSKNDIWSCIKRPKSDILSYIKIGKQNIHLGMIESSYHAHKNIPNSIFSNITKLLSGHEYNNIPIIDANIVNTWANENQDWLKINTKGTWSCTNKLSKAFADTIIKYNNQDVIMISTLEGFEDLANKSANNISNNQLGSIAHKILPMAATNYPPDCSLTISNVRRLSSINNSGINVGIISFDMQLNSSYNGGVETFTPILIRNIKLQGFRPVNETHLVKIYAEIPPSEHIFNGMTMFQLTIDANNFTYTKNVLRDWIKQHKEIFLGDVNDSDNANFPKNTNIVKVSGFQINDLASKTIGFDITVDKYYKRVGASLVESQLNDTPLTLVNKVHLTGFERSFESQITLIPQTNFEYTAIQLLHDEFKYTDDNTPIIGEGLLNLNKYVNLANFPADTEFKIAEIKISDTSLSFNISVNKHYNAAGIIQSVNKVFNSLEITGLSNLSESLYDDIKWIIDMCSFVRDEALLAALFLILTNTAEKLLVKNKAKTGKNYANYAANYIVSANYVNEWSWLENSLNKNTIVLDNKLLYKNDWFTPETKKNPK